jgi:type IV pilus assembly protein PilO
MDLKKFWSDLNNINPNDPGAWPWPVKITALTLIFVIVLVGGYFLVWQDQWTEWSGAVDEEAKLKDSFLAKKREAINLDLIRKQLLDTQQSFGALLKQLPSKAEMDELLREINQAGLGRGLQIDLFRPGNESVKGVLTEVPIAIRVEGSYDDLGKFASDVSQLSRIVILTNISITPMESRGSQSLLAMDATALTYRYRDETEVAPGKGGAKK